MSTNSPHNSPRSHYGVWAGAWHAVNERLDHFSRFVTTWSGSSWAFALAVFVVAIWLATGPIFGYSDTWQLVINTGTTIVTFLMVFLIQRSQNKESLAIQIKLNELLASQQGASNSLINVEDLSEEEILELHEKFAQLAHRLEQAADDKAPHSVAEARDAVAKAQESLRQLRHASAERKRKAQSRAPHS